MIAFDPTEIGKAAAFVKAIAAVETTFGYRLSLGDSDDPDFEHVTFGTDDVFAVVRVKADSAPGALGLIAGLK